MVSVPKDPILEGLVTTTTPDGGIHLAPMGPRVSHDWKRLLLRPFAASTTCRNLKARGEGVLHVTDDVLLIAKSALGGVAIPPHRAAKRVSGFILDDACRFYEFVVRSIDDSREPVQIEAEIVHCGALREFWGFNRAKHAVLEAAILATRLHITSMKFVMAEFDRFRLIVDKTGGAAEAEAFGWLEAHLLRFRAEGDAGDSG